MQILVKCPFRNEQLCIQCRVWTKCASVEGHEAAYNVKNNHRSSGHEAGCLEVIISMDVIKEC